MNLDLQYFQSATPPPPEEPSLEEIEEEEKKFDAETVLQDSIEIQYAENFLMPHSIKSLRLLSSYDRGITHVYASGCRSCGKTTTILTYIMFLCCTVPGIRILITRKEWSTIRGTILNTLEDNILRYPLDDPRQPFKPLGGVERCGAIKFKNGSRIGLMGIQDEDKLRGAEPNLWYCNEASRIDTPSPFRTISGSTAGGRGGKGGWQRNGRRFRQMIFDSNPGAPSHWSYLLFHPEELDAGAESDAEIEELKKKMQGAVREWLWFKLEDNPALSYDGINLNQRGQQTYDDLDADLAGVDRDRDLLGLWVAAEGSVFRDFKRSTHVISKLEDMRGKQWLHYRGIDFGDDQPFVCLWTALNKDNGEIITHREWRMSRRNPEDHADAINAHSTEDEYQWTVTDHNLRDREALESKGIETTRANKDSGSLQKGISILNRNISQKKVKIFKGALIKADRRLINKGEPTNLVQEIEACVYPENKTGRALHDDSPDPKCSDHGIDAWRYTHELLDRDAIEPESAFGSVSLGKRFR